MSVEVKIKKWGSSLGCIIPKDIIEKKGFKENDTTSIIFVKNADFNDIFGTLETSMTAQELKEYARDLSE